MQVANNFSLSKPSYAKRLLSSVATSAIIAVGINYAAQADISITNVTSTPITVSANGTNVTSSSGATVSNAKLVVSTLVYSPVIYFDISGGSSGSPVSSTLSITSGSIYAGNTDIADAIQVKSNYTNLTINTTGSSSTIRGGILLSGTGDNLTINNSSSASIGVYNVADVIYGSSGGSINITNDSASIYASINGAAGSSISVVNKNNGSINVTGGYAIIGGSAQVTIDNNSATITGNISLGSNSASSFTTTSSFVYGDVTLGNLSQKMTISGSGQTGTNSSTLSMISGIGTVEIASASANLYSNFGLKGSSQLSSLVIDDNLGYPNIPIVIYGSIYTSSTGVSIGSSSFAEVKGSIYGGKILLNNGSALTVDNTLNVYVASSSSSLKYGTLNIAYGQTLASPIGSVYGAPLDTINIQSNAAVTVGATLLSNKFNIGIDGTDTSAITVSNGYSLGSSGANVSLTINDAASLTLNNTSNGIGVYGTIDSANAGSGVLVFAGSSRTYGNIGSTKQLGSTTVSDTYTVDAKTNNNSISTKTLTLSGSGSLTTGSGTLTVGSGGATIATGTLTLGSGGISVTSGGLAISGSGGVVDASGSSGAITVSSGGISLASGSILKLGSGGFSGAISGSSSGNGTVNITSSITSGYAIGATKLASVVVADGATLDMGNNAISATAITLGNNNTSSASLKIGSGGYVGTIDSDSTGYNGVLEFTASYKPSTGTYNLGATNKLSQITIDSSATLDYSTSNSSVTSNKLILSSGSTLKMGTGALNVDSGGISVASSATLNSSGSSAGKITVTSGSDTGTISLASGAALKIGKNSISAIVDGADDYTGDVYLDSGFIIYSISLPTETILGNSKGLNSINFINGRTTVNNSLKAKTITIGSTASASIFNGISVVGDVTASGQLTLKPGSSLSGSVTVGSTILSLYSGATVSGAISGSSSGVGTVYVQTDDSGTFTASNDIGSTKLSKVLIYDTAALAMGKYLLNATNVILGSNDAAISTLNIGSGGYSAAIDSDGTANGGVLNFTASSGKIVGDGNIGSSVVLREVNIADATTLDVSTAGSTINAKRLALSGSGSLTTGSGLLTIGVNGSSLGTSSVLKLGSGGYQGSIDSDSSGGHGTVEFASSFTSGENNQNIGSTYELSSVQIDDGASVDFSSASSADIKAANLTLLGSGSLVTGSGSVNISNLITINTGTLTLSGSVSGDIVFADDGNLLVADGANISGYINNTSGTNSYGTVTFNGSTEVSGDIGNDYLFTQLKALNLEQDSSIVSILGVLYTKSLNYNADATLDVYGGIIEQITTNDSENAKGTLNLYGTTDITYGVTSGAGLTNVNINNAGDNYFGSNSATLISPNNLAFGSINFYQDGTVVIEPYSSLIAAVTNQSGGVYTGNLSFGAQDTTDAGDNSLNQINVSTGVVSFLSDVYANKLNYNGDATVTVNGGVIASITNSSGSKAGTINFASATKVLGDIGATGSGGLSSVNIENSSGQVTLLGDVYSDINLDGSSSNLALGAGIKVSGAITTSNDNQGKLEILAGGGGASSTVITGQIGALGVSAKALNNITIDDGAKVQFDSDVYTYSLSVLGSGTLDQTSKAVTILSGGSGIILDEEGYLKIGSVGYSGTINGSGDNYGTVEVVSSVSGAGDIGTSHSIKLLQVDSGATFALGNNLAVTKALTLLGSASMTTGNSLLTIGSSGISISSGKLSIGSGGLKVTTGNITIGSGGTIDSSSSTGEITLLSGSTIILSNSATLKVGTGGLSGIVNPTLSGSGKVIFSGVGSTKVDSAIGSSAAISQLEVSDNFNLTLGNNLNANSISIGSGTSGSITTTNFKTITGNVTVNSGATFSMADQSSLSGSVTLANNSYLKLGNSSSVGGAISASSASNGIVEITGTKFTASSNIGSTKLSKIIIDDGKTFASGYLVAANNIVLGNNNTTAATLELSGSSYSGNIDSDGSANKGILNIKSVSSSVVGSGDIGSSHPLAQINISNGAGLDVSLAGSKITAAAITLTGTASLTTGTGQLTVTDLLTVGSGILTLGGHESGNISLAGDATIVIASNSNITGNIDNITGTDSKGSLTLVGGSTVIGNIGATKKLKQITIAGSSATNVVNGSVNVDELSYAADGKFSINSATIAKITIGSKLGEIGSLTLNGSSTINAINGKMSEIKLDNTTTNYIGTNGATLQVAQINFVQDATLVVAQNSTLESSILNASGSAYKGNITFSGDATISGDVGQSNLSTSGDRSINKISVNDFSTTGIDFQGAVYAKSLYLNVNGTVNINGGNIGSVINNTSIANKGTLNLDSATTISGNIGASGSGTLAAINVSSSSGSNILQGDVYSNITLKTSGAEISIAKGKTIYGNITTQTAGQGGVTFLGAEGGTASIITGSIGESGKAISIITVEDNALVYLGGESYTDYLNINGTGKFDSSSAKIIVTRGLTLDLESTFILGSSGYDGTINGNSKYYGTVEIASDVTLGGAIGSNKAINILKINDNTKLTSGYDIMANKVNVGVGSSLIFTGPNIISGDVNLSSNSQIILSDYSEIRGNVSGLSAGVGSISVTGNYVAKGILGKTQLSQIVINDNRELQMLDYNVSAKNIILGSDGSSDAYLAISSGGYSGNIDGVSDGNGQVLFESGTLTTDGAIGSEHLLNKIQVNSSAKVNLANDIAANNTDIKGILLLGNSQRKMMSNVTVEDGATLDLGNASHIVSGSLTFDSGATIALSVTSSSSGNITSSSLLTLNDGDKLTVNIASGASISSGSKFLILSGGDGSIINSINSSDITITNVSGTAKISTLAEGNSLYLRFDSSISGISDTTVANTPNNKKISDVLNNSNPVSGSELDIAKNYINNSAITSTARNNALSSMSPQVNNGIARNSLRISSQSMAVTSSRLDSIRSSNINNYDGFASGDECGGYSAWAQALGFNGHQSSSANAVGYKAKAQGIVVGFDNEIYDGINAGISFSYADSNVKSKDLLQSTQIDSYQFNAYQGKSFDNYFISTMEGFAWNDYQSSRSIPIVSKVASANFSGQTYIALAEVGMIKDLGYSFDLTPRLSMTYSHNHNQSYNEGGAGTLDLAVRSTDSDIFEGKIGSDLNYNYNLNDRFTASPYLKLYYGYDFIGDKESTVSNFIGQSSSFKSEGDKVYKSSIDFGAGVNMYSIDGITLTADYIYEYKENYQSNYYSLRLRYQF